MDKWWQQCREREQQLQQQHQQQLQELQGQQGQQQKALQQDMYKQWRLLKLQVFKEEHQRSRQEVETATVGFKEEIAQLRNIIAEQRNTITNTDAVVASAHQTITSQQQQIADLRSQLAEKDRRLQQITQLLQPGEPTSAAPQVSPGRSISAIYQGDARISLFGPEPTDISVSVQQPAQ
jgi:chromosome segregation ATPase